MTKDKIRSQMRLKSRSIGVSERTETSLNIFSTIELDDKFINSIAIAFYFSLPDEVPTHNIVERWHAMGKRLFLPRVKGDIMEFVEYKPNFVAQGAFGIIEPTNEDIVSPSEIELMIVPGVAFCSDGRRLGRGRGYYDKYLSLSDFNAYTIGVGYTHQLVDEIPCEPHDVRLSRVITPYINSDKPSLSEIIVKIIDRAGTAAEELGCGVDRLLSMGLTWVLSRLSIDIFSQPDSMDDLIIETWIEDCSRIATTRNFVILNRAGDKIGVATSQWCMIDMKRRRPVDLTASEIDYAKYVQPRNDINIERPRKIPQLDSEGILTTYHTANELDIDFNNHVNTMRYIEMMTSMMDKSRSVSNLRIDLHFVNESLLGDQLTINHKKQLSPYDTQLLFDIIRPDEKPSVRAMFCYRN